MVLGKAWLIQWLGTAIRGGASLAVAEKAPGRDLCGHDDLVIAAVLAVLAADLAAFHVAPKPEPFASSVAVGSRLQK